MSLQKFESEIKQIPFSQTCVYEKMADLNNLAVIKERINDPALRETVNGKVEPEKFEQIANKVREMTFDSDSVTVNVSPLGEVSLRVVNREEPKCVKFETANSPLPLNLWIQLMPTGADTCKMKLTIQAELNPFIKMMVSKPLQEGVERLADMLAAIPYGSIQ